MRTCAWSAQASPAARPRWISRSAATASCCSRPVGSAGAHRVAAADRRYSASAPRRRASSPRSASRTHAGCGTSRSKRWRCSGNGCRDHAIDCDLNWGHLHVATKQRQRRELAELQQELAETYGYRSPRLLERADVESLLATQRYCGGLYDPGSGHLHPLNYTLGLARAAEAAGVRICESSAVTSILPGDPRAHRDGPRHRERRLRRAHARRLSRGPAHHRRLARDAGGHLRRLDRTAR